MLMNSKQLQEYLGISRRTLYRLIKDKDMPRIRIGSQWRFDSEDIDKWIKSGGAA